MAGASPPAGPLDAKRLADAHAVTILVFLVGAPLILVVATIGSVGFPTAVVVLMRLAVELVIAASLFRLARSLREPGAFLWAAAPLVHFMLGVVVFAILNMKARRLLRALGHEPGILGARVSKDGGSATSAVDPGRG